MLDNPYQASEFIDSSSDRGDDPNLDRSVNMLRQTKPWVRFISVMMFIGSVGMILGGLVILVGGMPGMPPDFHVMGVVYIVMAPLYLIPAVFLWRYADRIALFVQERSTGALASALEAQKSFWKFVGIFMLVILVLYAVGFVIGLVGMLAAGR